MNQTNPLTLQQSFSLKFECKIHELKQTYYKLGISNSKFKKFNNFIKSAKRLIHKATNIGESY